MAKLILPNKDNHPTVFKKNQYIKTYLGSYILLSLEFLIVADVIETIIKPTFQDTFKLALVVLIRTLISYFLNNEINEISKENE
ncbi:MAG: DUF1622 domain-containing protein [Lactococcus garvieae]